MSRRSPWPCNSTLGVNYEIIGTTMQAVEITLATGESVVTEAGGMAWISGEVDMSTKAEGGLFGGIKRKLAGESFFQTTYTAKEDNCLISFNPYAPGKVLPLELTGSNEYVLQRDAFMVSETTVERDIHFQRRLGAGFFGGEGFILQRVYGTGVIFVEVPGEVVVKELAPNEELKVDPGHIALYDSTIDFDVKRNEGVRNIVFSGEGLFLAHLRGPGRVWLQTMTLQNLAAKISQHSPSS